MTLEDTRTAMLLVALHVSGPLSAQHSTALFETTTPIRVTGTVVRYTWANPHSAIVVEQQTEDGGTVRWALESSAPIHVLENRGFTSESFEPGDVVEACGFAPRQAFRAATDASSRDGTRPGPTWPDGADRIITARLLLTQHGPEVHWSHYGPLELCLGEDEIEAITR
jgi:hypothetical protein